MESQPYLSVIIPSYNELRNLERGVLDEVANYLRSQPYTWEVLLSDDGSTDGTVEKLEEYAKRHAHFRVVKNVHAGKAPTVESGVRAAAGEWKLFTDFDQSTPISEVEKLLAKTHDDFEVVIGSREGQGAKREKEPIHRHVMGRVFNLLVQILALPGIADTQCGFKLFSAEAAQLLFDNLYIYGNQQERTDAFTGAFDVELLYLARKAGLRIAEVPIAWKHAESARVSPVKDSLRMLRDIVFIRFASLTGHYATVKAFKRTRRAQKN